MSVIRQVLCVLWLAAGALAAAPPNIVLITLDTVRADRMGFLGSKLGLTPSLDALARDSAVFARAYSQVPLTTASHATILTGTYPQFHKVNDFQVALATDLPYAPEILHRAGYRTAAFVGAMVLDPKERFARGFDRGFETYDAGFQDWQPPLDRYHTRERRAGEVVARALEWLKQHPKGPFFLWVHLYDAHYPYDPPQPYKSKYATAPYDGEIAYTDSAVGKLLSQLRVSGLYDGAVIAVASDHGEALGDHGEDTHGIFLYDESIHVPLLIKLPNSRAASKPWAAKRIEARVGLMDVLPTLLQTAGVEVPPDVQGESLLSMMRLVSEGIGGAPAQLPDRPAYSETDYPQVAFGWSSLRALRTGKYLYIEAPRRELYDLSADPKAEHDLSSTSAAVTSTLASQLEAFRQKTSSTREAPRQAVVPEAQAKLAALGYIAAGSNESIASRREKRADPKDKIEIGNQLHRTNFLIESLRFKEAIPILQQLIAKAPDMPLPYAQLGTCFLATKDFAQAAPVLRKLVELNPEPAAPHFQLAMALLATDEIATAVPELEIVVEKVPGWDQARLMLATAYFQTERAREAVTECEKILETIPNHYAALLLEGQILVFSKQAGSAIPRLERAAAVAPERPEPHTFLADAYTRLGQKEDAARERANARRLAAKSHH
jgi:arylsulfatase A-like enzyme/thioredoxin-like negative regulator of GroEL